MKWINRVLGRSPGPGNNTLQEVQREFTIFRDLLDLHNSVLKRISHLEEVYLEGRMGGLALWDEFIRIRGEVGETIEKMIELGGGNYLPLRARLTAISQEVEQMLPIGQPVSRDQFIIPFRELSRERANSVGTKNANLGEMQSVLGLPVPAGFAISAWAYQHFIEANQLREKIDKLLKDLTIRNYQDLEFVSEDIRQAVTRKPVPEDLAEAIYNAFDALAATTGKSGFALRSSAIGEDTSFSFAGQYLSFLNVPRDKLLDHYRQILASKFTPSAIYYLLSHSISDLDLGMGVACLEMVDATASGVVYTLDPVNPGGSVLVVNSIFGLGSYLVDGTLTPDVFHLSRTTGEIVFQRLSSKPIQLRLDPQGGIVQTPVPLEAQTQPSLEVEKLTLLREYALQVEKHFGCPQDIEWAVDQAGKLYLVQARPLNIPPSRAAVHIPAEYDSRILLKGGLPICAGVGSGPVFHLTSMEDLDRVPGGAVLVTANPSPYLVMVMDKIRALVTLVGGNTSHLATLARELGVPTVVGLAHAGELPAGREITVDAAQGVIYDGDYRRWMPQAQESAPPSVQTLTDESARKLIYPIVHLNVIHPSEARFTPENCHTLHDILRFIHQKAMEELFTSLKRTTNKDKIGLRLKTSIPLIINIIYLDQDMVQTKGRRWIPEQDIQSQPMQALWGGILEEGWPQSQVPADLKGFLAVMGANIQEGHHPEFSENSYAFLSREYMLLNLRMGYHFSTIESMATPEPAKNYIRMQFKLGGAPLERRIRRIWLISELLRLMGFENSSQSDFLDSTIAYQSEEGILDRLKLLGRITIITKQLDMALSSDARTRWYYHEFAKKLNLEIGEEGSDEDEMRR
jgi:pyruvate, water dikinase